MLHDLFHSMVQALLDLCSCGEQGERRMLDNIDRTVYHGSSSQVENAGLKLGLDLSKQCDVRLTISTTYGMEVDHNAKVRRRYSIPE